MPPLVMCVISKGQLGSVRISEGVELRRVKLVWRTGLCARLSRKNALITP